jgi:hypothetical protein
MAMWPSTPSIMFSRPGKKVGARSLGAGMEVMGCLSSHHSDPEGLNQWSGPSDLSIVLRPLRRLMRSEAELSLYPKNRLQRL